jgi:capping protein beta
MPKLGYLEELQRAGALALLKRLPPQDLEKNLASLRDIAPHLETSLDPYIAKPSKLKYDAKTSLYFIASEYNCDGQSHRSPWSNTYIPEPKGGSGEEEKLFRPPERLRRFEESFNEVFDAYKTTYYEGGVSSVYVWDLDEGFAGAFLIRKEVNNCRGVEKGVWDITHVAEVRESTHNAEYRLYTTLVLHLLVGTATGEGETELGCYFTRQSAHKNKKTGDDMHLQHIGKLIEDTENSLRMNMDAFYMAKHREVVNSIRTMDEAQQDEKEELENEMKKQMTLSEVPELGKHSHPGSPSALRVTKVDTLQRLDPVYEG